MLSQITTNISSLTDKVTKAFQNDFEKAISTIQLEAPAYVIDSGPLTFNVKSIKPYSSALAGKAPFGHPAFDSAELGLPADFAAQYPTVTLAKTSREKTFVVAKYIGTQGGKPAHVTFTMDGKQVGDDFVQEPFNHLIEKKIPFRLQSLWRGDTRPSEEITTKGFTIMDPAQKLTKDLAAPIGSKNLPIIYASYVPSEAIYYGDNVYNFLSYGYDVKDIYGPDPFNHYTVPYNVPKSAIKFTFQAESTDGSLIKRMRNLSYIPPKLRDMKLEQQLSNADEIWGNGAESYIVRKGTSDDNLPTGHMHEDILDGQTVRVFDYETEELPPT
jgi:hypothetical protein